MSSTVSFSTRRLLPLPDASSVGMRFVALGGVGNSQLWGIDCQGRRCLYDQEEWHIRDQTSCGLKQLSVNEFGDGLAVGQTAVDETDGLPSGQALFLWRSALNDKLVPVTVPGGEMPGAVVLAVLSSQTPAGSSGNLCYFVMESRDDNHTSHQVYQAVLNGVNKGTPALTESAALGSADIVQVAIGARSLSSRVHLYGLGVDRKLYVYDSGGREWNVVASGPYINIGSTIEQTVSRIYTVSAESGQITLHPGEGSPVPYATRRMFSVSGVVSPESGENGRSIVTLDRSGNVFRDGPEQLSRNLFRIESRGMLLATPEKSDEQQQLQWVEPATAGTETIWQVETAEHGPMPQSPETPKNNACRAVLVQNRSSPDVTGAVFGSTMSRNEISIKFGTQYYNSPDPFTLVIMDGKAATDNAGFQAVLVHEQSGFVVYGPDSVATGGAEPAWARAAGPMGTSLLTFRPVASDD